MSRPTYQRTPFGTLMEPVLKKLSERLRTARRGRGLSLEALAEKSGFSEETVRKLEKGNPGASLAVLYSVMRVLNHDTISEADEHCFLYSIPLYRIWQLLMVVMVFFIHWCLCCAEGSFL